MKKLLMVVSIICLLFLVAVDTPPALPSSFYGNVSGAKVGQVVTVLVASKIVANSQVFLYNGQMVYSIDVPMGANCYIVESGNGLPDQFIVYQLVSSTPNLHADNLEKYRTYRMQVTIWDRNGLINLPDMAGAMISAGFRPGPKRELPYEDSTRHFGLVSEFLYLEMEL